MSLRAGTRGNRAVERRSDVLTFSSEPLGQPADIIGEVTAELSVTRNNPHADLFVRLCDVDPRGRSRNVCDGIVRLTGADPLSGITAVPLLGVAHRFRRGHRIRLQVSGGAHPRFARNPGTGQVDASPAELTPADYRIGVLGESTLLLPVVTAAGEPSPAGPLARSAAPGRGARAARGAGGASGRRDGLFRVLPAGGGPRSSPPPVSGRSASDVGLAPSTRPAVVR